MFIFLTVTLFFQFKYRLFTSRKMRVILNERALEPAFLAAGQCTCVFQPCRLSMIHETEQDYKLEIRDSQNLAENEEQRNLRLQRLRESRSLEKVNPYEYKRELNSKDMTDYRSLVTTLLVERQNRLQLLQQNAAMYRENKRLQHLRD